MRHFYLLPLLSLCALLLSSIASAQAPLINTSYDKDGKTTAKVTALFSRLPNSGYMPIRLEVKNSDKTERAYSITCVSHSNLDNFSGDETSKLESEFQYTCPAGSSKTFDLIVPIATSIPDTSSDTISNSLEITLKSGGKTQFETLQSAQLYSKPAVLLSAELFTQHASSLDSYITSTSGGGFGSYNTAYSSSIDPSQLPNNWQAYVGYDSLVCTDRDWNTMTKGVQNAILEWNRLGGRLLLLRLNNASNLKTLGISSEPTDLAKKELARSFGSVSVVDIPRINDSAIPPLITKQLEAPKGNKPRQLSILSEFDNGKWSIKNALGKLSFNPTFLIIILIAFGILVGPVNLFVFAKSGLRHKLFITTPIIAIGASMLLIAIIILQDGFGGHGNRIQLVEVRADNGENKAYVKQEQIARTGVVLGSSFETSVPAYITPVPLRASRYSRVTQENLGGNANYFAEHGKNGLAVSGDWFQSRSEHGHYLESVVSTRGRITLKSNGGEPVLNSSFNYPIKAILYRDTDGQYWKADDLESGKSLSLYSVSQTLADRLIKQYSDQLTPTLANHFLKLSQRNDHFIAFTEEAPAIDTLDSINWQNTTSIITGPVVK